MAKGIAQEESVDFDSWVESERSMLDSHYESIRNVTALGTNSGELRLRIDHDAESAPSTRRSVAGLQVESVTITRAEVPNPPESAASSVTYHAVVTGFTKTPDGQSEPFHTSEAFLHQMAAMSWVEEYVPDFDLYPLVLYTGNEADETYTNINQERVMSNFWD